MGKTNVKLSPEEVLKAITSKNIDKEEGEQELFLRKEMKKASQNIEVIVREAVREGLGRANERCITTDCSKKLEEKVLAAVGLKDGQKVVFVITKEEYKKALDDLVALPIDRGNLRIGDNAVKKEEIIYLKKEEKAKVLSHSPTVTLSQEDDRWYREINRENEKGFLNRLLGSKA